MIDSSEWTALMQSVIAKYRAEDKSLRRTAAALDLSEAATRKILITAGEYDSPRKREIDALRDAGMTVRQIADKLGVSDTAVDSFIPYRRGTYLIPSQTKNAAAIRRCRKAKGADNID